MHTQIQTRSLHEHFILDWHRLWFLNLAILVWLTDPSFLNWLFWNKNDNPELTSWTEKWPSRAANLLTGLFYWLEWPTNYPGLTCWLDWPTHHSNILTILEWPISLTRKNCRIPMFKSHVNLFMIYSSLSLSFLILTV